MLVKSILSSTAIIYSAIAFAEGTGNALCKNANSEIAHITLLDEIAGNTKSHLLLTFPEKEPEKHRVFTCIGDRLSGGGIDCIGHGGIEAELSIAGLNQIIKSEKLNEIIRYTYKFTWEAGNNPVLRVITTRKAVEILNPRLTIINPNAVLISDEIFDCIDEEPEIPQPQLETAQPNIIQVEENSPNSETETSVSNSGASVSNSGSLPKEGPRSITSTKEPEKNPKRHNGNVGRGRKR